LKNFLVQSFLSIKIDIWILSKNGAQGARDRGRISTSANTCTCVLDLEPIDGAQDKSNIYIYIY